MEYDLLGRLMRNIEPNTGNDWRYVWDDAGRLVGTSDARGCGENLHYDGLSRLIGEDYSPCLASQPAYSAPNSATGEGFEVFYRYDGYEDGQATADPGFPDLPRYAAGNLVAVTDRGSHTRFSYDARNRLRRVGRQIATPDAASGALEYAPQWFTSRIDYDQSDRLVRRTSGADVAELLVGGSSEERYAYTPRGQLGGIDTSYGAIVRSQSYNPDGMPARVVYGDGRGTVASFGYDDRHRLSLYQLIAPKGGFALPLGHFDFRLSGYDDVGNPLEIEDFRIAWQPLPAEAAPQEKRTMAYDDLYRLIRINTDYKTRDGSAPWRSPFATEEAAGDRHPLPLLSLPTRIRSQDFNYDGIGNITTSSDDLAASFDRSLGADLNYGSGISGPNQLRSGTGLHIHYDAAGNVTEMKVARPGNCPSGSASRCAQWFAYDWDEVGQLSRARRWDFAGNFLPTPTVPEVLPTSDPDWDIAYAYSQGARVRKGVAGVDGARRHTLAVFDTLRIDRAAFPTAGGNYEVTRDNTHVYLGGAGHAFWDASGALPHQAGSAVTMNLVIGDHLGSATVVINHSTGEQVERTTYQPYGATESDHRPTPWAGQREVSRFTGKEEDVEVGLLYFGARYYLPNLGRFLSADPLTIHGLGSDLNPYAYVNGRVTRAIDLLGLCTPGSVVSDPNGTTTTVQECPDRNSDSSRSSNGEALASVATSRQMTSFVREHPDNTASQPSVTPAAEEQVDTEGDIESSAGGFRFPKNLPKSSYADLIAITNPALAPRIRASQRSEAFIANAPLLLMVVPGAQGEGALSGLFRGSALTAERAGLGEMAWGAPLKPAAIESALAPRLTMADGYAMGSDLGSVEQTLALGKYPSNVQFVRANPGSYTLDRPWGWSPSYNAGVVRGQLEAGGPFRLTSEEFTGTYKLEVEQILNQLFR